MNINTNYTDINTIKSNPAKKYENLESSKLEDKSLRKVTDDFESFFMQQLLDISLKNTSVAGKEAGSDIIKGMYTEAVSKETNGALGISDMLYEFLSKRSK